MIIFSIPILFFTAVVWKKIDGRVVHAVLYLIGLFVYIFPIKAIINNKLTIWESLLAIYSSAWLIGCVISEVSLILRIRDTRQRLGRCILSCFVLVIAVAVVNYFNAGFYYGQPQKIIVIALSIIPLIIAIIRTLRKTDVEDVDKVVSVKIYSAVMCASLFGCVIGNALYSVK